MGLARIKNDPESKIQMSSVQSLVTLQGVARNNEDMSKQSSQGNREQADDFSLFERPLDGNHETNNTFHEVN